MSYKMYAFLSMASLSLAACNSDDNKKETDKKDPGEMIRATNLAAKKINADGLDGLWLQVKSEETVINETFSDGQPYTDIYKVDSKSYLRVSTDGDTLSIDDCEQTLDYRLNNTNQYVSDSTILTRIDDNEIHGKIESDSYGEVNKTSFKMVKVSSDINTPLGTAEYSINNNDTLEEGELSLSCYNEIWMVMDLEEKDGPQSSTDYRIESEFSDESSAAFIAGNKALYHEYSIQINGAGNFNMGEGPTDTIRIESLENGLNTDIDDKDNGYTINFNYHFDF